MEDGTGKGEMVLWESRDVARPLGVSTERVRQEADAGRLEVYARTPRGMRLFRPEAVLAFAERRRERALLFPRRRG